jgi:hypothetical protein
MIRTLLERSHSGRYAPQDANVSPELRRRTGYTERYQDIYKGII